MFKRFIVGLSALFLFALCPIPASAVFFYGTEETALEMIYTQPNEGTPVTFTAKRWGNSIKWEHETSSGYTIAYNHSTGYWCYAILNNIGNYTYSDSAIGINNPPPNITTHLRRSSGYEGQLHDLAEETMANLGDFRDDYLAVQGNMHNVEIGILFWEFSGGRTGEVAEGSGRYTQDNVNLMTVSEGEYFGERYELEAQTPWGEEPFGSIRDYFLEISGSSDDEVSIEAG